MQGDDGGSVAVAYKENEGSVMKTFNQRKRSFGAGGRPYRREAFPAEKRKRKIRLKKETTLDGVQ